MLSGLELSKLIVLRKALDNIPPPLGDSQPKHEIINLLQNFGVGKSLSRAINHLYCSENVPLSKLKSATSAAISAKLAAYQAVSIFFSAFAAVIPISFLLLSHYGMLFFFLWSPVCAGIIAAVYFSHRRTLFSGDANDLQDLEQISMPPSILPAREIY
jgi:hypothetical protein